MATTTGQRLARQTGWPATAATVAAAAVILACAAGLAILTSRAPSGAPSGETPYVSQVHAAGRGLLAGTGSYTESAVAGTAQAASYASGRGGEIQFAGLEETAAQASTLSPQRGGVPETIDVR